MSFYVYQYKDPETLVPFYIGKGCKNRADRHLTAIRNDTHSNKYFAHVVKTIWARGQEPTIEILVKDLGEQEAYDLEQQLILKHGRRLDGGTLTNLTLGGAGPIGYKPSKESNDKRSKALKGKQKTEQARANMCKPNSSAHNAAISLARSWEYVLTSPSGEVINVRSLKLFSEERGLKLFTLKTASKHGKTISKGPCKGWKVTIVKEKYGT